MKPCARGAGRTRGLWAKLSPELTSLLLQGHAVRLQTKTRLVLDQCLVRPIQPQVAVPHPFMRRRQARFQRQRTPLGGEGFVVTSLARQVGAAVHCHDCICPPDPERDLVQAD
jgi:hypothetical protein